MPGTRDWLETRLPEAVAHHFRNSRNDNDLTDGSILNRVPEFHDPVPCPESALAAYKETTSEDSRGQTKRFTYIRFPNRPAIEATLYRSTEAAFGTVTEECFWTQRHGVIAYLSNAGSGGVLRVRALKDGRDFASLGFRSFQAGGAALIGLVAYNNLGDWHLMLDRPENETFRGQSVSLVIDAPANWEAEDNGRFVCAVDRTTVQVTPGVAQSAGRNLDWQASGSRLELPLHQSSSQAISLANLVPLVVILGIAIGREADPAIEGIDAAPTVDDWPTGATPTPRELEATWKAVGDTAIIVPTAPVAYPFPG